MTLFGWRVGLEPWHQWQPLYRRGWNWVDLWILHASFEVGGYKGRYAEATLAVLGFGLTLEAYNRTERRHLFGEPTEGGS